MAEHVCALCGRAVERVSRHHLVPRSRVRKAKRRGREVTPAETETVPLCRPCHGMVHATLSEKELQRSYPTLEALREHPEIGRFVRWVRKQDPSRGVRVAWTRERRG